MICFGCLSLGCIAPESSVALAEALILLKVSMVWGLFLSDRDPRCLASSHTS